MDATTFDGISRNIGTVSTRRGFVRLLGGAAAVGAVVAAGTDTLARGKGHGKGREQVSAQGKGKGKKVVICYLNQTKTVKKSKLGNYPGATKGACPAGGTPGGGGTPVRCTTFILSGGPNQSDPILIDDDGSILNVTASRYLVNDVSGAASPTYPVLFDGQIGDKLRIRGTDWGGCRSFSPLWVHCLATGQKRQIFTGYSGANCTYPKGDFLDITVTVEL